MIFGSLAAIGAGLHVAAYYLEHETTLTLTGTVLSTVVPVTIYIAALYGIYASFTRHLDPFHLTLLAGSAAVLVLAVALAGARGQRRDLPPRRDVRADRHVVGYETLGHRHVREALARMRLG